MVTRSHGVAGRPGSTQQRVALAMIVTVTVVVYACNSSPTPPPTSPTPPNGGGPGTTGPTSVTPGVTTLCKFGPGGTFLVRVGVQVANAAPQAVSVDAGQCVDVAKVDPASKDDVIVSIAENAVAFAALDHILMQHGQEAERTMTRTNTLSFEGSHGAIIRFFNNAIVTVCKAGTSGTFQYQVGEADAFHALSLTAGQCATIASLPPAAAADDVIVTVRENAAQGTHLDHVTLGMGDLSARTITGTSNVSFEGLHGALVTFFNVAQ